MGLLSKERIERDSLIALSLGVLVLFVMMLPAAPELEWGDSGTYINMAHALAQGKGLRLTYLSTEPGYPIICEVICGAGGELD
jgi:hypothetical protein